MDHGPDFESSGGGASTRRSHARAERVSSGDDVVFNLLFPGTIPADGRLPSRLGRDEVLDKLSHELRTPITTIYGGSKVLRRPAGLPDDVRREVSAAVEAEADRLYHLVEDILALARLGNGGRMAPLGRDPVLLQHLLPSILRLESARVPARTIVLRTPRLMPAAAGDREAIGHAVRNLVANALQHGAAPGGSRDQPIEVGAEAGGSEVRVRVRDHGPGIDPEEADALFEPFYRSERTADTGGAGLGLAATRRLVDAMGGRTWAAACTDGGAEFGLALPRFEGLPAAPG